MSELKVAYSRARLEHWEREKGILTSQVKRCDRAIKNLKAEEDLRKNAGKKQPSEVIEKKKPEK